MVIGFPILELPIILRTPQTVRQQTTLLQPPLWYRLAGSAGGNYSLALSAELHGSFLWVLLSKGNWIMLECLRVLHQRPVRILSPLYSTSYPTPCWETLQLTYTLCTLLSEITTFSLEETRKTPHLGWWSHHPHWKSPASSSSSSLVSECRDSPPQWSGWKSACCGQCWTLSGSGPGFTQTDRSQYTGNLKDTINKPLLTDYGTSSLTRGQWWSQRDKKEPWIENRLSVQISLSWGSVSWGERKTIMYSCCKLKNVTRMNSLNCLQVMKQRWERATDRFFPQPSLLKLRSTGSVHLIFGTNSLSLPVPVYGPISIHNHLSISMINLASALLPASSQTSGLIPICTAVRDIPNVLRIKTQGGPNKLNLKDREAQKQPGGEMGKSDCQQGALLWGYFFWTK